MQGEKRLGRLDVPKQIRVGTSLGRLVRRLAELENRPIGQQLVVLVTKGVEQHCREGSKEVQELFRQVLTGSVR